MKRLFGSVIGVVVLTATALPVFADGPSLGAEVQAYPAGVIAGPHVGWTWGESTELRLRPAYNFTDRRDWGEHDDESGGGAGGGIGVRRGVGAWGRHWLIGVRADLWWLKVDWRRDTPSDDGSTDVVVLQPTLEAGLRLRPRATWTADLMLSLGQEFNIDTRGEDVGEGTIALLGLTLSWYSGITK